MSSPKARFTGAQPRSRVRDLTHAEVLRLRDLWPRGGIESAWGHPGDEFAASLGDVVLGVRAQRHREIVSREDARAELHRVARQLREAEEMLRTLSPEVDVLLGVEADPLGCADKIQVLLARFEQAEAAHATLYAGLSSAEHERRLMLDVCVQVSGVLRDHGIEVSATAVVDLQQQSVAVACCAAVGELSGIPRSPATWRDLLADVRRTEERRGNMPS